MKFFIRRNSGCIRLPSQCTLRDYTHYIQAESGFSEDIDKMLMEATHVNTCPDKNKYVVLLIDKMYVREGIVYEKHSGWMIGFSNLGATCPNSSKVFTAVLNAVLAKTMVVFMVRGLFNKLQFPYAQFPCGQLTGDQLYYLFWEAVGRIENCGLKVFLSAILTTLTLKFIFR